MAEKPATTLLDAQRRQDVRKAEMIQRSLDSALQKLLDARSLLSEAANLADTDMHADVSDYDAKDIRELYGALKIASIPLRQKVIRFSDIVEGRKQHEKENKGQ